MPVFLDGRVVFTAHLSRILRGSLRSLESPAMEKHSAACAAEKTKGINSLTVRFQKGQFITKRVESFCFSASSVPEMAEPIPLGSAANEKWMILSVFSAPLW